MQGCWTSYAAFCDCHTTGLLSSHSSIVELLAGDLIAAAVAALAGVILGSPTCLWGDYLAIVTLGFGEIVPLSFAI